MEPAHTPDSGASVQSDQLSTRDTMLEHSGAVPGWLVPPFALGRYLVTERIGKGGAGVVFRARDPELAREVAIKVVVPRSDSDRARARLLGEAQAIAKLSHPNVVAVFDVGELPAGAHAPAGIYMVMELLDGVSLRRWLSEGGHDLGDVLDVLLAAGRGLEAAHQAGLVHRDFKPDNVVVGARGRVHVLDFGLALADAAFPSTEDARAGDAREIEISGTPGYMAPEQHVGVATDARADLFSFCVTCWEALHGAQPYQGRTLEELAQSKARGCPPAPTRRIPRWLHEAIARGLAVDPTQRPASLTELLDHITRRRHRRRNVAVGAVSIAALGGLLGLAWSRGADARACIAQGEQRLAAAWNDDARERARAQFEAIGLPYANDAWTRVQGVLDDRAAAWRDARQQVCEGGLGDGGAAIEQTVAVLACLDGQLDELGARVEVFAIADRDVVRQAARLAERMPLAERCLDTAWVATTREGFGGELEAELLRIRLQIELGRYDGVVAAAQSAAAAASEAGDLRREARARMLACRGQARGHHENDATALCTDAWVAAERAGSTGVVISAMLELLGEAGLDQQAEAERLERLIRARIDGRPPEEREPILAAELALTLAQRARMVGRWQDARAEAERAIEIVVELRGEDDPGSVPAINELALASQALGEIDRARALFEQAATILLATRGPNHPDVISLDNNTAGLEIALGRYDAALARLARVRVAKEAIDGGPSPWLLTTLYQQVEALVALGDASAALAVAREATTLAESALEPTSTKLLPTLLALSWALRVSDRCAEALDVLARIDAIAARSGAPDPETSSLTELEYGRCLDAVGRADEAGARYERATAGLEQLHGERGRGVAPALLAHARHERALGRRDRALALLDRATEICRTTEGDPALPEAIARERAALP